MSVVGISDPRPPTIRRSSRAAIDEITGAMQATLDRLARRAIRIRCSSRLRALAALRVGRQRARELTMERLTGIDA